MCVLYSSPGRSPRLHSPASSSPGVSKESPTLIAKHLLMTRRQVTLDSPSQGSTPGEMADEEVNKLSDEVRKIEEHFVIILWMGRKGFLRGGGLI